jgi:choline dehydrogenase-like flavoprotein
MNIAADGTRVSAARAFLRPALSRPNLTLLLNTDVVKLNFNGTRCVGVKLTTAGAVEDIEADKEVLSFLSLEKIAAAFSVNRQLAHVDRIFRQVFRQDAQN